jgi:hypothetical protein
MAVAVDASGQDVAPCGVEVPAGGAETSPQRRDDAPGNAKVGLEDIGRGGDHSIPDDRVELRHGYSSLSVVRAADAPFGGRSMKPLPIP